MLPPLALNQPALQADMLETGMKILMPGAEPILVMTQHDLILLRAILFPVREDAWSEIVILARRMCTSLKCDLGKVQKGLRAPQL